MKNSIKNLFKKTSTFLKKGANSFKSTFKKYPKILGFLSLLILFVPVVSLAGISDDIYLGFLQVILTITNMLKTLASIIIYSAGLLFDNLLVITLSTDMYDADWVKLGWSLIRDIANIAFILGVVVIGFLMITGGKWKQMLINLIIVVFIMNFSMFFGRVIIDAGNFTAAIFYSMSSVNIDDTKSNAISNASSTSSFEILDDRLVFAKAVLGKKSGSSLDRNWEPYFGNRSISTGLVAFVNPTGMYTTEAFEKKLKDDNKIDSEIKTTLIILNIVFILTMVVLSSAFIRASFMFISRTVHLIKWIIAAPIYFAWYFLPGGNGKLYEWFGQITNKAFCVTSYMVGMWLIFLFLSSDVSKLIDTINSDGVIALISLVVVKSFLIFKAIDLLTEMGTRNCNDGEKFGEGLANFASSAAGFVGGGFIGKGIKYASLNSARSIVGSHGQALREWGGKLGANSSGIARWAGDKMLAGGNTLYSAKISGQSFKDEVDSRQKREGEMLNMLTDDEKKKRFYHQQGGKNAKFVGTKEKRSEVAKELAKMRKERNSEITKIKNSGGTKKEIEEKVKGYKEKNDEKIEKFKKANMKVISTSQEKFNKMDKESDRIKYINQNPQGLEEKRSVMSQLMGTAEHEEAAAQVLGKKSVESKLKREKDALKKKDDRLREKYMEKESEINDDLINNKEKLSTAEKKNVSNMKDLADKFREMYDVIGEGNDMVGKTDEQVLEYVSNDDKLSKNNESLSKLNDRSFREGYVNDKNALRIRREQLDIKKNNLAMKKASLDTEERDQSGRLTQNAKDARLELKKAEDKVRDSELEVTTLEKNIAKTEADIKKGFDKAKEIIKNKVDSKKKIIKEEYSDKKAEINDSKAGLDKEATQVKDNIAAGIHTHNPNRHNVNTVVTTID